MSFRFDAASEYVDCNVTLPSWDACTIMAWVYISVDRAATSYILQWPNSGGTAGSYCGINASRQLFVEVASQVTGTTLATGTWYHLALATGASNATVYLNGVQDAQQASASFTPVATMWGGASSFLNGRVAALKVFAAELTAAQIAQEMRTIRPSGDLPCHAFYPCIVAEYADLTGNGRILVSYGSPTIEDGPPVGWGAPVLIVGKPASGTFPAWGQQTPDADEIPLSWSLWQTAPATPVVVDGDGSWGKLTAYSGETCYSSVHDIGSTASRQFTVQRDKYGTGSGNVTISIRGSDTSFAQHDGSPSWSTYTGAVTQSWRYVQLKIEYAA